jgi:hypothetical protein
MTTLYLSEYKKALQAPDQITVAVEPSYDQPPLVVNATAQLSAGFQSGTCLLRVHTDSTCICSIAISAADENTLYVGATVNSKRLAANSTEYFGVAPGQKLSAIINV